MSSKNVADTQQEFANKNVRLSHLPVTRILIIVVEKDVTDILNCEDFKSHQVIAKLRKGPDGDSRTFTDENGKIYPDWDSYKNVNTLEGGIMVAPLNGYYTFDAAGKVKLEFSETPAASAGPTIREVQQDFAGDDETSGSSQTIYVLVTNSTDLKEAENSRVFSYHPVIRSERNGTFVDEDGNTYQNWEAYKGENKLGAGILVAPTNGRYTIAANGQVELEAWKTAAINKPNINISRQCSYNDNNNISDQCSYNDNNNNSRQSLTIHEYHNHKARKDSASDAYNTSCIIYVLVTKQTNMYDAMNSQEFTTHKVLRIQNATTESYFFIDDANNEYFCWQLYLTENNLPEGIMVAPLNGIYSFNKDGNVDLEICLTPACIPKSTQNSDDITIRNLQQHYATMSKYLNADTSILHILVTNNEHENVLEAKIFQDFVVKRKGYTVKSIAEVFYEDEEGNRYSSWEHYLRDNDLPKGIMVAPLNGEYTLDENGNVNLYIQPTPKTVKKMRTVLEVQQDFANNSGFKKEIIWDLLAEEQSGMLKDKLNNLIPDQKKGNAKIVEMRKIIFDSVWAQRKYTNRNSLSAIIYVFVTDCDNKEDAINAKKFSCHPVFRTRKCTTDGDSSHCCMIFIDELGRVYQNWKTFLANNELPSGLMIAPLNGIYTTDYNGRVQLEVHTTPNGSAARQVLGVADTATAVAGLGAAAIPLAAMMMTVAPALIAGAGVVCATTAAYSTVRSVCNLVDRKKHEQPIGLDNSQARNAWIGVGAGVVGVGASGATNVMTKAAAAGQEISLATELLVNGMNISSIVLSGTGVANGILDLLIKYRDDEEVTSMELVQLAASLVLFTHSVSNFRMASTLVNDTHSATIQDYRKSLSNRQRKIFDKMSKETIRIKGAQQGKVDIIRGANDMPSKQYLNDLYKINKKLNEAKVRPAFGAAGEGVVLNNDVAVNTNDLRNNLQHNKGPNVLNSVNKPIPTAHAEVNAVSNSKLLFSNVNNKSESSAQPSAVAIGMGSIMLPNNILISLSEYGTRLYDIIANPGSFDDIITTMADAFSQQTFDFLMKLAQEFVETKLEMIRNTIQIFISAETILYRIFLYVENRCASQTFAYLYDKKLEILNALNVYFNSLNPNSSYRRQKCDICGGSYSICQI
ncbi:uncharacterized protein LOC126762445 isoform X2 [Bactrocera neohumeralis]|uniref:uncharacterized protein LOC126762445 isoform X2 n=1 Tax=Bactrocera neohumeralis TaxID=98809 RepID=UPI0021667DFA|nr:uncharacterized protein LOC126762445 isoform X2 [Bactrocera neohumeralis]